MASTMRTGNKYTVNYSVVLFSKAVGFGLWLVLFAMSGTAGAELLPDEQNNVEVYKKAHPAVVNITTTTLRQDFFFDVIPQQGSGSGALIRNDGYIVTNDHVVGNANAVEVTFSDKTTVSAEVVGTDPDSDLAVIRVAKVPGKTYPALAFADPEKLAVGQKVLAIGNPFGLGGSLTTGIVSSIERVIRTQTDRLIKDIIQTDAAINPGNSGGPLLDSQGRLIGINSQIISRSGGSHGIGFAISVKTVKMVVEQLIAYGKVLRPDLGMDVYRIPQPLLAQLGVAAPHGVMVLALDPKGLAAKAGFRRANKQLLLGFRPFPIGGDVIFKVDDRDVVTERDLFDYVFEKKVGDTITLHFARGAVKKQVAIKLALPTAPRQKSI
jgi:S1-C subfamily serine protease